MAAEAAALTPLAITGYHGSPTAASLIIVTFDRARRLRRALTSLLALWGAMVVSVFIPIAHFVLVPSLFVASLFQFVRRLKAHALVRGVHGACPDCGAEQDFEVGSSLALPQSIECRACHRGLTLSSASGTGGRAA